MSLLVDVAKNFALAIPAFRRRRLAEWRNEGCGSVVRTADYVRSVFELHHAAVERHRSLSGRLLEIGPGSTLGHAALFVQAGMSEAMCIDIIDWREETSDLYSDLGIDNNLMTRIEYVCPCAIEEALFPDAYFDVIVSHAAFQRFHDPGRAIANIARMLCPGGVTTHQIDLRDNRDLEQPLEFLKVSEFTWRLSTSRRSATNRWRASEIEHGFADAGLEILERNATNRMEVTPALARKFTRRFRSKSLDDLGVLGLFITARKPAL